MIYSETKRKLLEMHLSTMAATLEEQLTDPTYTEISFEDRLGMLVDAEYLHRKNNRLKNLMKKAMFSVPEACIEDIDYLPERKLDKEQILRLASCNYVREKHNIVIQGATGSGKTYLATAFGVAAVKQFISVKYMRLPDLLTDLKIARATNDYPRVLRSYTKIQLLILDEWLLYPLSEEDSRDVLEIVEYRYHNAATIFCSQFDVKGWYDKIPNPLLADAVCDRIAHDSYYITLSGNNSMRKYKGIQKL